MSMGLKISLASDLHLDGIPIDQQPKFPAGDVLLLAGDIIIADALKYDIQRHKYKHFFDHVTKLFDRIFIIAGNHEYYHSEIEEGEKALRQFYSNYPKIEFLQNEAREIESGVMLWGGTLWTDYKNHWAEAMLMADQCMNDHWSILRSDHKFFKPKDAYAMHREHRQSLLNHISAHRFANPEARWIVMTHHVPFYEALNTKRWGEDNSLNYAFGCTDMWDAIEAYNNVMLWHSGHTHDANDLFINDTRMIINPLGYRFEKTGFREVQVDLNIIKSEHSARLAALETNLLSFEGEQEDEI